MESSTLPLNWIVLENLDSFLATGKHPHGLARDCRNLGNVCRLRGDIPEARKYRTETLELLQEVGISNTVGEIERLLAGLSEENQGAIQGN